jgi:hypothetical protein
MSELIKKEKSGLFSMTSKNKVVDFNTFRKAPDKFIKGVSIKSGDSVKKIAGDKDYKKLIRPELMMEALKKAGVDSKTTNKVLLLLEKKQKRVSIKRRLNETKSKKQKLVGIKQRLNEARSKKKN